MIIVPPVTGAHSNKKFRSGDDNARREVELQPAQVCDIFVELQDLLSEIHMMPSTQASYEQMKCKLHDQVHSKLQ